MENKIVIVANWCRRNGIAVNTFYNWTGCCQKTAVDQILALNYVWNRRDTAETYLEDGRCSFTNNLSENALRPSKEMTDEQLAELVALSENSNLSKIPCVLLQLAKSWGNFKYTVYYLTVTFIEWK